MTIANKRLSCSTTTRTTHEGRLDADGVIDRNDMVPDENGNLVYLEVIMPLLL
jgi:hypothetical protein